MHFRIGAALTLAALASPASVAYAQAEAQVALRRDSLPGTTRFDGTAALRALRVARPIAIDGRLDDEGWKGAQVVSGFTQYQPQEGSPATEPSEVMIAFDDEALYIGAVLHDAEPARIQALLSRRDRDVLGDRFIVYLDPYHDRRTGFYFGVNAAGTLYDGTLYNDGWDNSTWDGVWQAKTHHTAEGWVVEMRIPLSQLRFRKQPEAVWGINFQRVIARKGEQAYLVPRSTTANTFVSRFRDLGGLDGLAPRQRVEVLPYVTSKAEFLNTGTGNPLNSGSRVSPSAGFDAKLGLGANLTLDATVNPDFGQVEVDPAVVNLSDTEVFFDERRPFFIEGAQTFTNYGEGGATDFWGFNWNGVDILYSRRIGRRPQAEMPTNDFADTPSGTHILGALKLTGKVSGWNVATLGAVTQRERGDFALGSSRFQAELEPTSFYGATRAQREFNDGRQGFGVIGTLAERSFDEPTVRDQVNGSALVTGVDGWTYLGRGKSWVVTGWAARSAVTGNAARITALQQNAVHYFQRPDEPHVGVDSAATSLDGWASRFTMNKERGNVMMNAALAFISPGFEANDLGFQSRADVVNAHYTAGYRWTKPTSWYRTMSMNAAVFGSGDFGGRATWAGVWHRGRIELANTGLLRWANGINPIETLNNRRTRGGPLTTNPTGFDYAFGFDTDQRKLLKFGFDFYGNQYGQRSSAGWEFAPYVAWKPASNVLLRFAPGFERQISSAQYVGTFADPLATATFGNRYIFGDLDQKTLSASLRLNWIFKPNLSLEVYAQPLVSSGHYRGIRELAAPRTFNFVDYNAGGAATYDRASGMADPDGPGGPAAPIDVGTPDFTFTSLRGNAILRWEYASGSTLFFVWTQNRVDDIDDGTFHPGASFNRLFSNKADNIFLVKATYWWSR